MPDLTPKEQRELNKLQKDAAEIEAKRQAGKKLYLPTLEKEEKIQKEKEAHLLN